MKLSYDYNSDPVEIQVFLTDAEIDQLKTDGNLRTDNTADGGLNHLVVFVASEEEANADAFAEANLQNPDVSRQARIDALDARKDELSDEEYDEASKALDSDLVAGPTAPTGIVLGAGRSDVGISYQPAPTVDQ